MSLAWKLEFSDKARKQLRNLDNAIAVRIVDTLERNVEPGKDPRATGGALAGKLSNLWRYRVGDYRVLVEIEDARVTVTAVEVGHRSDIYR